MAQVTLEALDFVLDPTRPIEDGQDWSGEVTLYGFDWNNQPAPVVYDTQFVTPGIGVDGGFFDQIDFTQTQGDKSERLEIDFGGFVENVTLTLGEFHAERDGLKLESGAWTALDADGNVLDQGVFISGDDYANRILTVPVTADEPFAQLHLVATGFNHGTAEPTIIINEQGWLTRLGVVYPDDYPWEQNSNYNVMALAFDRVAGGPVANDDGYKATEDTPLAVDAAAGVLSNDSDVESDPFVVIGVLDLPNNGALSWGSDGSFTYTPNVGFTGLDNFTYEITGGDTAVVTINVTGSGDGVPVTAGLVAAFEEGNVSVNGGVVTGWTDSSGQGNNLVALGDPTLLTVATPTGRNAIAFDGTGDLLQRVNGTDTLNGLPGGNADRTMFFVVNYVDGEGVASGLVYGDGAKNQAFGLVSKHTDQDLVLQGWGGNQYDFDSDVDGPTQGWIVQSVVLQGGAFSHYLDGTLIDSGSHTFATDLQKLVIGAEIAGLGESELEVGAALIYDRALTPAERQQVENFLQTKYITGTGTNQPAVTNDDGYATTEDTALVVNAASGVLDNDSDAEGDFFEVTGVTVQPTDGSLTLNADGSFTYTPDTGFVGQDNFTYEITGGATAVVTVNVTSSAGGVPVTAGLVAAFQEGNVALAAGNAVAGWLDGSGFGNNLTAAGDPTLLTGATPTGRNAIAFDGTGDLLQRVNGTDTLNGLPGGNADRTMFFVVNYVDGEGVASGLVYGDGAKNQAFGLVSKHTDQDLVLQGWGGNQYDFDSDVDGPTQGWMVQSVVLQGGAFSHYLDGTLIDSGSHTFATDLQKLVIGAEIAGLGESELEVSAALIYDRALTESERLEVEEYLQTMYIDDAFAFA